MRLIQWWILITYTEYYTMKILDQMKLILCQATKLLINGVDISISACMCVHEYVYIYVCVCVCVCVRVRAWVHTLAVQLCISICGEDQRTFHWILLVMYTSVLVYFRTCINMCVCSFVHIFTRTRTHTHTHTHTYIYMYIPRWIQSLKHEWVHICVQDFIFVFS